MESFLVTGASGFLGRQICQELLHAKKKVVTLGYGGGEDFEVDITRPLTVELPQVDCLIHCAGKAHVIPKTAEEEKEFFAVNFEGTKHILQALQKSGIKQVVFISTVAVYGVVSGSDIKEDSELLGNTPYAQSKIDAEHFVEHWAEANEVSFMILRLPLIAGQNPPGNLGAMFNAIEQGYYFRIGKAESRRSIVSAKDIGAFIAQIERPSSGTYNLTDGEHPEIAMIEDHIAGLQGKKIRSIPFWVARSLAMVGDIVPFFPFNRIRLEKLTQSLTFNDRKARNELSWNPGSALRHLAFDDEN